MSVDWYTTIFGIIVQLIDFLDCFRVLIYFVELDLSLKAGYLMFYELFIVDFSVIYFELQATSPFLVMIFSPIIFYLKSLNFPIEFSHSLLYFASLYNSVADIPTLNLLEILSFVSIT